MIETPFLLPSWEKEDKPQRAAASFNSGARAPPLCGVVRELILAILSHPLYVHSSLLFSLSVQGCSTLSTEFPLEERMGAGESGSISILTEC